jgi:hypothetical protein
MRRWLWAKQLMSCNTLVVFLILVVVTGSYAADLPLILTTKHTILTFNTEDDVATFNDSIRYEAANSLASIFSSPSSSDVQKDVIRKVDLLFEKVQLILDMRKPMKKVTVRIHSNEGQLKGSFMQLYQQGNNPRGWYLFENNTVYLNVKDVHEGMLAHELGHAIIDNFLSVRPPKATAEILAKYVDVNLFNEVK